MFAALQAGGSSPADNPFLSASASTLNFSSNVSALELELRNGGGGELTLLELGSTEPWLVLQPLETDADGVGLYRVNVDREGLDNGVYSADITARSSVNSLTIRVVMSVGDESPADVGVIYILLYEQETDEAIAQASATSNGGSYMFAFNNVPPGQYQVFAGSDADNDLLICDSGEACGSWLTIDQPIVIDVDSDQENIDFPVDYLVTLPSVNGVTEVAKKVKESGDLPRQRK